MTVVIDLRTPASRRAHYLRMWSWCMAEARTAPSRGYRALMLRDAGAARRRAGAA